jgi:hypothetical protein
MPAANAFALWEAVKGISHLFSGSGKEEPLTQQTASAIIPSLNDEAIQAALDTTLHNIDPEHLQRVQKVRTALESHQRNRWRKVITTLELTERFEAFTVSEKTAKTQGNGDSGSIDPQAQSQRKRTQEKKAAREETTRTFDRRKRDYEYTAEDPRVQHFVFISKLVASEQQEADGINKAKAYLLSAGLILEKSIEGQVAEKASQAATAATSATYHGLAKVILGDEYEQISASTHDAAERDQLLSEALKRKSEAKKQKLAAIKTNQLPKKRVIIAIIGIIIAAAIIIVTALA